MRPLCLTVAFTLFLFASSVIALHQEKPPNSPTPAVQTDQGSESLRLTVQVQDLYKQGKYDEAIPLAKRVLQIEEGLNSETANVATALSNLAELYFTKGDDGESQKLFERAAAIYEKNQIKSPLASNALERLAQLAFKKRNHDAAIRLLEQSLAIREQIFGRDSVPVSETLHELANVFQVKRQWDRADPLYLRSIAIKEQVLGRNNEDTIAAMKDYACVGIRSKPHPPVKEESRRDLSEAEVQQESIRLRASCWLYGFGTTATAKSGKRLRNQ